MLTVRQAAAQTGKHPDTIYAAISRGKLRSTRADPGRTVLIDPADLAAWQSSAKVGRPRTTQKGPDAP